MRAKFQIVVVAIGVVLTALGASAQAPAQSASQFPDLHAIVARMQAAMADRNRDRAYSVTREYTLVPEDASKAARVVAEVHSVPSGKKDYVITEGNGEAEKVVRKVLDHETESYDSHSGRYLTTENYDFALLGTEPIDGHTCYVLQLTPRHDGKDMVAGKAWVDAQTFLVRQLAGSPTKSPSWWIKDLQVTLHYRDVDGLWLQDSTQAVAQVRFVGKHILTARDVNVQAGTAVAALAPARIRPRSHRRSDPALIGAGVFVSH